jgi:membrane associated rhomboid family serine protease
MLIAPYSTDAPIYHRPWVTGGLIVANVLIFFATTFQLIVGNIEDPESIEWLILKFDTINPLQWISGAFMHGDFMHLLGNMFFLWAFGLVVEGKIGNLPFLGLYMLMAAIDGAAVQVPMFILGSEGGALGASGVIFALMVIAMLWAPENEMDCFYFAGIYTGTFEIRIVKLGGCFMMLQLFFLWLGGFTMSSEMLHLIGAAIGTFFGLAMLRQNLVDCEGWDFISRNDWLHKYPLLYSPQQIEQRRQSELVHRNPVAAALALSGSSESDATNQNREKTNQNREKTASEGPQKKRGWSLDKLKPQATKSEIPAPVPEPDVTAHPDFNRLAYLLRQAIESGTAFDAQQHFRRMDQSKLAQGLPDKLLMAYVQLVAREKNWPAAIRPLMIVASHAGPEANQAKLRIGQIQVKVMGNPEAATNILKQMTFAADEDSAETRKLIAQRDQLLAQAKALHQIDGMQSR